MFNSQRLTKSICQPCPSAICNFLLARVVTVLPFPFLSDKYALLPPSGSSYFLSCRRRTYRVVSHQMSSLWMLCIKCFLLIIPAKTDTDFKAFLDERNPKQQHSSTLESYLIKPIQRVLKYPLLLKELYSLTDPDSEEHYHLDGKSLSQGWRTRLNHFKRG